MWFRYLVTFLDVFWAIFLLLAIKFISAEENKGSSIKTFGTMFFAYIASAVMMWI